KGQSFGERRGGAPRGERACATARCRIRRCGLWLDCAFRRSASLRWEGMLLCRAIARARRRRENDRTHPAARKAERGSDPPRERKRRLILAQTRSSGPDATARLGGAVEKRTQRSGAAHAMRSTWIVPPLRRSALPPRALVRQQRSTGLQGSALPNKKDRSEGAAQRGRDT